MALRRTCAGVVVLVAAVAFPAQAADAPGVSFAETGPIAVKDADVPVVVCNSTDRAWSIEVTGEFSAAKTPSFTVAGSPLPLGAGTCGKVVVRAVDAAGAAGTLVARAPGAGLDRRPVSVTPATLKPGAALNTFDLKGHFDRPGTHGKVRLSEGFLILSADAGYPLPTTGTVLGWLADGRDTAKLVAGKASYVSPEKDVVKLAVTLEGADGQGVLKGRLTALADKDGKAPAIAVTVADHWLLLALAVVAGVVARLLANLLSGRVLLDLRLRWRGWRLQNDYATIPSPQPCGYVPPNEAAVRDFVKKNQAALAAYAKTTTLYDSSSAAYKKIAADLDAAASDAKAIRSRALCDALNRLAEKLTDFESAFSAAFPGQAYPVAARKAKGLVDPENPALTVGQATKIIEQVASYEAFFEAWTESAKQYRAIPADVKSSQDEDVCRRLHAVEALLLDVGDSAVFDKAAMVAALRELHAVAACVRAAGQLETAAPKPRRNLLAADAPPLSLDALFDPPGGFAVGAVDTAVRGVALAAEVFILFLSAGLTLLVAAKAIYADKPFGTVWDYLAAFALGAGAEALVSGAVSGFARWRTNAAVGEPAKAA